jgi:hypothetical protein
MLFQGKVLGGLVAISLSSAAVADGVPLNGSGATSLRSQIEAERSGMLGTSAASDFGIRSRADAALSSEAEGGLDLSRDSARIAGSAGTEAGADPASSADASGSVSGEAGVDASISGDGEARGHLGNAVNRGRELGRSTVHTTAAAGAALRLTTSGVADTAIEAGTAVSAGVEARAEQTARDSIGIAAAVTEDVEAEVTGVLEHEVRGELDLAVGGEIEAALDHELGAEIAGAIDSELDGELASAIEADLKQQVDGEIDAVVAAEVVDSIDAEVKDSVEAEVESEVETTLADLVGVGI